MYILNVILVYVHERPGIGDRRDQGRGSPERRRDKDARNEFFQNIENDDNNPTHTSLSEF